MSTDVRTLLHDLAADAPRGRGEETADLVVDLHRAQDRRRLRRAGVAAAIAVVVAVVPALVDRSGSGNTSAATSGGTAEVASLFDAPTRGSLADDGRAVAAALAASWDVGYPTNSGDILDPAPADRHVAFVGDVPGGTVWALVMGRTGGQLAYAWFQLVDPADPRTFRLSVPPARTMPGVPVALLDGAGDHGPMVVVGEPGDDVTLEPFAAASELPEIRSFRVEDGIGLADVVTLDGVEPPAYRVSSAAGVRRPVQFDSSDLSTRPDVINLLLDVVSDPEIGDDASECLVLGGWLQRDADGGLQVPNPSSQVQAEALLTAIDACAVQALAAAAASGQPDD
ncbi:hypothetical protein [Klenkia taihuensis]|uniref:Uncharacterized protein n=1 Tax=Klenkia taihuensis TaxID=1225127 RepID=A0A1I1H9X5_9ACTN|nr:hypothetical protein [Klenkia taihuensis]GHE09426.1 hypothetical protein GCM10011381_14160 [Klenkia taihuensis]SFC18273.1 hypothetical protein SAMN05661030_0319 [Klenkia taihuensis]